MKESRHENIRNYNVQDVFLRNAAISLLDVLNRQIVIQMKRNEEIESQEIPIFYNFGADEGFMKDFFMELPTDCKYPRNAEGNYESYPRGIVTLTNFMVRSSDKTNHFIRGSFTQEGRDINDQKQMKAYSSRLFVLPMTLRYTLKFECDNLNKTFKILEKILDMYHKNTVTYFQFRGIRIPAQITMPETEDFQTPYEFSYTDNKVVTSTLSIDFETYFPSFDDHSTRSKGNTIRQYMIRERQDGSAELLAGHWTDIDDSSPDLPKPVDPSLPYPPQ